MREASKDSGEVRRSVTLVRPLCARLYVRCSTEGGSETYCSGHSSVFTKYHNTQAGELPPPPILYNSTHTDRDTHKATRTQARRTPELRAGS